MNLLPNPLIYSLVVWLVVFYVPSTTRSFRDGTPHLLSLAKDMKLIFYTVSTGNRTLGRHMAVHYTTTAPCQLHRKNAHDAQVGHEDKTKNAHFLSHF